MRVVVKGYDGPLLICHLQMPFKSFEPPSPTLNLASGDSIPGSLKRQTRIFRHVVRSVIETFGLQPSPSIWLERIGYAKLHAIVSGHYVI